MLSKKDLCVEDPAQTSTPGDRWCSQQDVVASFDNMYVENTGDLLFRVVPNVAQPSLQMPVFSVFCDTAVSNRSFSFRICGQTIALNATTVGRRADEAVGGAASLERLLEEACPSIIPDVLVLVTGTDRTTVCRSVQHSGGLAYVAINSTALLSLHLGTTLAVQVSSDNLLATDLQIGTLWSDHATQVSVLFPGYISWRDVS